MTTGQPTNLIGNRLTLLMKTSGATAKELARFMDVTPAAIYRWQNNRNGIVYFRIRELAFLFGCGVGDLVDNGEVARPRYPQPADLKRLSHRVCAIVGRPGTVPSDFEKAAKERAVAYIEKYRRPQDTVPAQLNEPVETGTTNIPAQPEPAPSVPKYYSRSVDLGTFLLWAERLRQETGVDWFVEDTGKLRARKVTTVEY